jgi:lambda repressor-like predicted transcriptional regulator
MPAKWTGQLVGEIHNAGVTIKEVAIEAGMNPKYISTVLNSDADAPKAEARLRAALSRLIERKAGGVDELFDRKEKCE